MAKLPSEIDIIDCAVNINVSTSKSKKSYAHKEEVSTELRELVIRALKTGICDKKSAANTFNLSYPTVLKIYKEFVDSGEPKKKKPLTESDELVGEHVQFILNALAENCKYTLKDLREMINKKYGIDINTKKISNGIPPFHYSFKRINDIALATITTEIMNDHKEYCELFLQLNRSGRELIYFDETEFEVTMRRFPGSKVQNVPPPSVRIRNKDILVSMSTDGLFYYKAFDGHGSNIRLIEYLNGLFDLLSDRSIIGAVLIMGNATFTYHEEITEATQVAGHEVVFLPMCSSFINPVENMFSHWTTYVRAKKPSSEKELEALIGSFNSVISSERCKHYCNHVIDNATSCVTGRLIYTE